MPSSENHIRVEEKVFTHMMNTESTPVDALRFVITHMGSFRDFSDHLPTELGEIWDRAAGDTPKSEEARAEIERRYIEFEKEVISFMEMMDPDARTAFTEAVTADDINKASLIMESVLKLKHRATE